MGTRAALSVEEYLHTSFPDLDKEYRDGQLVERTLPNTLHGRTQLLLGAFFLAAAKSLSLWPYSEARVKLRAALYLIPDISVFYPDKPPLGPDAPPLVAIEIFSTDDLLPKVEEKLEEYYKWGVKHIWLVDPHDKTMYTFGPLLTKVASLRIPELGLEVTPADVFES